MLYRHAMQTLSPASDSQPSVPKPRGPDRKGLTHVRVLSQQNRHMCYTITLRFFLTLTSMQSLLEQSQEEGNHSRRQSCVYVWMRFPCFYDHVFCTQHGATHARQSQAVFIQVGLLLRVRESSVCSKKQLTINPSGCVDCRAFLFLAILSAKEGGCS